VPANDLARLALTVVIRQECPLCDEFLAALMAWGKERAVLDVTLVDVDENAELQQRFGWTVPVLLCGEKQLCHGHFDPGGVSKYLPTP
jgi:Glutaredoxin-like domain (DUF836)